MRGICPLLDPLNLSATTLQYHIISLTSWLPNLPVHNSCLKLSLYINTSSAHLYQPIFPITSVSLLHPQKNLSKYLLFCLPPALRSSCTHKLTNNKFVSDKVNSMSSRKSRSIQSGASRSFTEEQITDLIFKLQQLIPEICNRRSGKVSASKVLQETCNYISTLHREVDDLSSRLSELLSSADVSHAQAAIIRSLFM